MSQMPAWRRSFDRWSLEETVKLVEAWAPLYRSRRSGAKDAWVPMHIRGRARSSRTLVTEDWRVVAIAVNAFRANTPGLDSCRTHLQCKKRVAYLKSQYVKELQRASSVQEAPCSLWPFFGVLHALWADEVGGRGAPAAAGAAAAGADDGAAATDGEGGAAAGNTGGGTAAAVHGFGPSGDEHGDARASAAAVAESFVAATGSEGTRAQRRERAMLLSRIYEKKNGVVSGAAEDEGRGGAASVGDDGRGAATEAEASQRRRATSVRLRVPKRPRSAVPAASPAANMAVGDEDLLPAQALAAGHVDAAFLMKMTDTYKELRMKALEVEMEKAAAAHAGAGRRA